MGQQDARGEEAPVLVALQAGPAVLRVAIFRQRLVEILRDRGVEIDQPFVHQLQHHIGEGRLGQRCAIHDGVALQRQALFHVAPAESLQMGDLARVDHRDGEPLHILLCHQLYDPRVECRRIDSRSSLSHRCGAGGYGGGCGYGRGKNVFHHMKPSCGSGKGKFGIIFSSSVAPGKNSRRRPALPQCRVPAPSRSGPGAIAAAIRPGAIS